MQLKKAVLCGKYKSAWVGWNGSVPIVRPMINRSRCCRCQWPVCTAVFTLGVSGLLWRMVISELRGEESLETDE